ncbi:hypothetical protein ACJJTC_002843 [Scirpophaga incertulas]
MLIAASAANLSHTAARVFVTNERVLEIAQLPSLTALLKQRRLRWLGHVYRMESSRLPRRILLGEVAKAKRNVGRPLLRFKDCAKRDMAAFNIDHQNWQRLAEGRADWRRSVMEGCIKCDKAWFATLADKREKKLQSDTEPTAQRFSCQTCGRPCRSRIGLFSHEKGCLHKITPYIV